MTTVDRRIREAWSFRDVSNAALAAVGTAVVVAGYLELLMTPFALPMLSVALVVTGFLAAGWTIWRHRGDGTLNDRMVTPGLLLFFGFAAAMLTDTEDLVQFLL